MEEKLIEAVRERIVLYDTSHVDYTNTKAKMRMWDEIGKEIGLKSGSEAKIVWGKLRHSLRDALRRQRRCVRSGVAPSSIKPWKFQTAMKFLLPHMANSKRESNFSDESDEGTTQYCEDLQSDETQEGDVIVKAEMEEEEFGSDVGTTVLSGTSERRSSTVLVQNTPFDLPSSSSEKITPPQNKVGTNDGLADLLEQSIHNRRKRSAEGAVLSDKILPTSDSLYHFFMSMYETTRHMPLLSQHVVKNHVYQAVTDMEASLLNIPAAHPQQTPEYYKPNGQTHCRLYNSYRRSPSLSPSSDSESSSYHTFNTIIENREPHHQKSQKKRIHR